MDGWSNYVHSFSDEGSVNITKTITWPVRSRKILITNDSSNDDLGVRLKNTAPAFGNTSNTFIGTNFVGTSEAIMPVVDLRRIIPPFGLKLDSGTDQRLTLIIRDNLTSGMTTFNVIVYGFDRLI